MIKVWLKSFSPHMKPTIVQRLHCSEFIMIMLISIDQCGGATLILLDFPSAFDTIDHVVLFNPIRSGLFQTVNDPGGGGFKNPPYDLENYCVNLHHIIHVNFTRCFRHVPIGIFQKFAILTILHFLKSSENSCKNNIFVILFKIDFKYTKRRGILMRI